MKNTLRIVFGLDNVIGVRGAIMNGEEAVYLTALVPDKYRGNFKQLIKENKSYSLGSVRVNMSNCFIDKEVSSSKYRGSYFLLISNKASAKNASLEEQYFLVPKKDGTDITEELKKQFFTNNMKKLPLPLKEEWQDYFWDSIQKYFEPLESLGQVPYNGFVLKLPSVELLQELIELSNAASEFKGKFKRVPQLKSLLSVMDIQGFNFKEWQGLLKSLGGIERFKMYSHEEQVAIVRAFELFGNAPEVFENIPLWHSSALRVATVMLRMAKDNNQKQQIKSAFKALFNQFKESDIMYAIIGNFEKLLKEELQNIRNKNWDAIRNYLAQISYEEVATGAEELARVCSQAKVSEAEYKAFESLYFKNLERGLWGYRDFPTVNGTAGKVSWELLDMTAPKAWVVGIETYCCMHPHSMGGACLEYAGDHIEESGILRIHEKGKTVAQSFMWLSARDKQGLRTMVLDNIEVAGEDIRSSVIEAYKDFAEKMSFWAPLFGIKAITVGSGYSDVQLKSFCTKLESDSDLYGKIPDTLGYTDARTQWLLKEFKEVE